MYAYDELDRTLINERVSEFRDQVKRRLSGELTEDEIFCTAATAQGGVTYENTSATEPLVTLRYFGPETSPDAPEMGAYLRQA